LLAVLFATGAWLAAGAGEAHPEDWERGVIPDAARVKARALDPRPIFPAAIPEHQGITQYDGPVTCLACHRTEAEQMHGSVHYQQAGPTPNVLNIPGLAGERGTGDVGMNSYCGAHVTSRRSTCGGCHVGNGQYPRPEMTEAQVENIDCLMCHQDAYKRTAAPPFDTLPAIGPDGRPTTVQAPVEDENGFRYMPDEAAMEISTLEAARTVHPTTRASCLRCHAGAGGADGAKRGDISSALVSPSIGIDVHMSPAGQNLSCADCHDVGGHRVRGRGLDLRPNDVAERFTCESCHGNSPHGDYSARNGARKDTHADRVACQSCHIPTYGKGVSTEVDRDWTQPHYSAAVCSGQGGWKPEEIHASDLIPSYRWFDGRSRVYVLGESPVLNEHGEYAMGVPEGSIDSLASRLHPMKEHRSNSARHDDSGQLIPHSTNTFFRTGSFDQAVLDGMDQAGLSGDWSLVAVHTWQTLNHGVVSSGDALLCGACHDDPEFEGGPPRIDLQADFGYGLREPSSTLCGRCHEPLASRGFKSTHEKHVADRGYDCSTCHAFSRPDRDLRFTFPVSDEVVLTVAAEHQGSALLEWTSAARAVGYHVLRGSLADLRATGGDFALAATACLAPHSRYLSLADHDPPVAGEGWWYLLRPELTSGAGSYDSGGAVQAAPRDAQIAASGVTCP
jgi:hypothetical protein